MLKAVTGRGQLVTCANQDLRPKRGSELLDVGVIENATVIIENDRIQTLGTTTSLATSLKKVSVENLSLIHI